MITRHVLVEESEASLMPVDSDCDVPTAGGAITQVGHFCGVRETVQEGPPTPSPETGNSRLFTIVGRSEGSEPAVSTGSQPVSGETKSRLKHGSKYPSVVRRGVISL